jgi:hypothetical protein
MSDGISREFHLLLLKSLKNLLGCETTWFTRNVFADTSLDMVAANFILSKMRSKFSNG